MALSIFKDTVTIMRAPIAEKNGMEYRNWQAASSHVLSRVLITPETTMRDFEGRVEQISDRRRFRADYDADIEAGDKIIFEEKEYQIDGEIFHTKSPTGRVSSTRCALVRWEG